MAIPPDKTKCGVRYAAWQIQHLPWVMSRVRTMQLAHWYKTHMGADSAGSWRLLSVGWSVGKMTLAEAGGDIEVD